MGRKRVSVWFSAGERLMKGTVLSVLGVVRTGGRVRGRGMWASDQPLLCGWLRCEQAMAMGPLWLDRC
ncbi:hypothetical protein E2562_003112 [Oryza meyeriana var. granulata]|uniref:Uncharacterized protein n=1 Tax=Oryza meyeriana var. granulata TaxID=110450 RepID=A0A6G1E9G9_9ORYZ|nr:hypothetical protein E2562_003112 [Oryza meyeriana var. granulata]